MVIETRPHTRFFPFLPLLSKCCPFLPMVYMRSKLKSSSCFLRLPFRYCECLEFPGVHAPRVWGSPGLPHTSFPQFFLGQERLPRLTVGHTAGMNSQPYSSCCSVLEWHKHHTQWLQKTMPDAYAILGGACVDVLFCMFALLFKPLGVHTPYYGPSGRWKQVLSGQRVGFRIFLTFRSYRSPVNVQHCSCRRTRYSEQ